jgi:hypothetical protein
MTLVPPPRWTASQFEQARTDAIDRFREERMQEPLEEYGEQFDDARRHVENLLELSVDLTELSRDDVALEVCTDEGMLAALRYLAGPPISEDDLKIIADASLTASVLKKYPTQAISLVDTVVLGLDRNRFPWVGEDREPEAAEREAAIVATAAMIAYRKLLTARANVSKDKQEQATAAALVDDAGFTQVPPRTINTFSDAPHPGAFCHESMFGGRKADLVVRLWDGRCMPIECKVSNSSTNSVKRLNNDAAVKAVTWLQAMGDQQTVPSAVLAGVFKRHNLEDAQKRGLTIFWAHELDQLVTFVNATK